jgi:thiol:disulfide interchange protein
MKLYNYLLVIVAFIVSTIIVILVSLPVDFGTSFEQRGIVFISTFVLLSLAIYLVSVYLHKNILIILSGLAKALFEGTANLILESSAVIAKRLNETDVYKAVIEQKAKIIEQEELITKLEEVNVRQGQKLVNEQTARKNISLELEELKKELKLTRDAKELIEKELAKYVDKNE